MTTVHVSPRRAATRERLIDAALTVFAEKGVGGASVEEICDAAGFTRGAFYSNFTGKEDLSIACLEHQVDQNMAALTDALSRLPDPKTVTGQPIDTIIEMAVTMFLAAQGTDRTAVLASQELRLFAARHESVAAAYRATSDQAVTVVANMLDTYLPAFGYGLVMDTREAVVLLHAAHDLGAVSALIYTDDPTTDLRRASLANLLRTLITPARPNPAE